MAGVTGALVSSSVTPAPLDASIRPLKVRLSPFGPKRLPRCARLTMEAHALARACPLRVLGDRTEEDVTAVLKRTTSFAPTQGLSATRRRNSNRNIPLLLEALLTIAKSMTSKFLIATRTPCGGYVALALSRAVCVPVGSSGLEGWIGAPPGPSQGKGCLAGGQVRLCYSLSENTNG